MKRALILLTFITCSLHLSIAQSAEATDISGHGGEPKGSNGFLSESQEIGCLSTPRRPQEHPFIYVNILVRKSRFIGVNTVYKDIFLNGMAGDYYPSGYIDDSEIDDAIRALRYINDSLLVLKPAHKLTYEKRFTQSDFRIGTVFNPYNGEWDPLGKWDVYLDLDNTGYRDFIHLQPGDVSAMIELFEAAKEMLKML